MTQVTGKKVSKPLLRRPAVLASGGAVVLIAAGWWLGWMRPEANKLAAVRAQQVQQQQTQAQLNLELITLKAEAKQVHNSLPLLRRFESAIPARPEAPALVVSIYNLATSDGVNLQSVTDNTVTGTTSGYSTIPVSLSVSGPHDSVLSFVSGLYKLPRLLAIQQVALSGSGNVNSSSSASYTATISATAYTTEVPATTASAASAAG